MNRKQKTVIAPELAKELDRAAPTDTVTAVFQLRPEVASGKDAKKATRDLLRRVANAVGKDPTSTNVFEFLGTFAIAATPKFVRAVAEQPEIASAIPDDAEAITR